MSNRSVRSLAATIAEQEQLVQEADRRLAARLAAAFGRVRTSRPPLSRIGLGSGVLTAAWFLLRQRRGLVARARVAHGGDRMSVLLNSVLPLLAPAIGVRAAGILTALASVPVTGSNRRQMAAPQVDLHRYAGTWY